jgi:hypothetical protein
MRYLHACVEVVYESFLVELVGQLAARVCIALKPALEMGQGCEVV